MQTKLFDEEAIFNHARKIAAPEERQAYLHHACGENDALRGRVAALLKVHEQENSFLSPPVAAPAVTLPEPLTDRQGAVIGPYKLLQQIGEGGMGVVYMAEQHVPVRRKVALKIIKPGMDSKQVIAHFEAERQAVALMDHPNIACVFDAGTTETGRPYFVMELVHGVPITKYCDDNHLPPRERLELFIHVCQAVQHAHQKGVIHRDLKPSNVLVCLYDGTPVPKVIDFGVAKATSQPLTERTMFTQFGTLVGTLEYMSPEQAEMSQLGIDTRSDVYSLGVLLYELLTGATPLERKRLHEAAFDEVLRIIREEEPPKPSMRLSTSGAALAGISAQRKMEPGRLTRLMRGELDWIVMKSLEKDRSRRYDAASAFAADVQHFLRDEPVTACPPSSWYRFRKFARRRRAALTMAAVVAAALVLAAVSIGWTARDQTARAAIVAERDIAIKNKERAEGAEQRALDAERENKVRAHLGQATALRLSQEPGRRARAVAEIRAAVAIGLSASLRDALRNEAIACLAISLDLTPDKMGPGLPAGTNHFDFDGKLERYARADRQGNVSIRRVADDKEIAQLTGSGRETWLRFSLDGQFLLTYVSLETPPLTQVWKINEGTPALVFDGKGYGFDFHPNKPLLAVGGKNDTFEVHDLNTRKSRTFQAGAPTYALAWHPRANQLAVTQAGGVKVFDLDKQQWIAHMNIDVFPYDRGLAWHPEGRQLAIVCTDLHVRLWNVDGGKAGEVFALERLVGGGIAMSFNHRGDLLATTTWGETLTLWDPRTGKQLKNLDWRHSEVPRFSSDDRLIAAGSKENSLQFWQVNSTGEYRTLVRDAAVGGGYHNGAIGVEGRLLAVGMKDGVGLWDLNTATFVSHLPIGNTTGVAFDHSSSPEDMITNGPDGIYRWPVRLEPQSARLRIGPAQKLALPGSECEIVVSRDGQIVAQPAYPAVGGRVFWQKKGKAVFLAHDDSRSISIHPTGRWIVTGSHNSVGARIWEAANGKPVKDLLPNDPSKSVEFSPDGQWLATQYPSCQLWKTGTWEKARGFPDKLLGFAPDGKMLAVETGAAVVCLLDPASGQEFAHLANPYHEQAVRIFFSPDGTLLVTISTESYPLHVWDLRKIRGQLAELDLDWDLPPYAPPKEASSGKPLQVQVDLGDLAAREKYSLILAFFPFHAEAYYQRGLAYSRFGQWPEAATDFSWTLAFMPDHADAHYQRGLIYARQGRHREAAGDFKALHVDPKNAEMNNEVAWLLATHPEAEARDPPRSVELAKVAVALASEEGTYWNTLGVAHYRTGDWKAALEALHKSTELDGENATDSFFLAMAHWQLGEKELARMWYDRAGRWMEKNQTNSEELRRFRAEAAQLVGIEQK